MEWNDGTEYGICLNHSLSCVCESVYNKSLRFITFAPASPTQKVGETTMDSLVQIESECNTFADYIAQGFSRQPYQASNLWKKVAKSIAGF